MKAYTWTPEAEAKVIKARAEGWSNARISRAVGCSPQNIDQLFQRIEIRNRTADPILCVKLTDDERKGAKNLARVYLRMAMGMPYEDAVNEVIEGVKRTK